MSEMIKRVARAICCNSGVCAAPEQRDYVTGRVGICQAHTFLPDARAAIKVMRQPTDAMRAEMARWTAAAFRDPPPAEILAHNVWTAGIEAALLPDPDNPAKAVGELP